MLSLLTIATTTVVGLMVGVELAVAVVLNRIVLRLPAGASIAARADSARMLGGVMPFWYVGSLLLTVALTAFTWGTAAATGVVLAAALLAISVVMSVVFLVPINNRSAAWTAESHPADWREQYRKWDRLHYLRVAIIVVAFVLVVAAVTAQ
ncbi:membrane protein [Pseudoclavibacter endophyticus]|uniref:DUF1772 domain-containing protein n=1 Tax=Pseudoclavibacter endophyticus TaxID=1778590 RepID=A0A6H9WR91_9MICO|nr:DUF1772 domain-containing protein [Pseudoclavibacter endophyticus]KAB1649467.1 DUF1772 domain-containing protein [Pseudoclavibacter endophyticus]GGA62412.1 membrane protein [Pseudoclavibacter endophyticus]